MATAGNPEQFPRLAPWLASFASMSSDRVISSADALIEQAFTIQKVLPDQYTWLFHEQDTLDYAMLNSKTGSTLNIAIWGQPNFPE